MHDSQQPQAVQTRASQCRASRSVLTSAALLGFALFGSAVANGAAPVTPATGPSGFGDPLPAAPQLRLTCDALGLETVAPAAADLPRQLDSDLHVTTAGDDLWVQLLALPTELAGDGALPLDQLGGLVLGTARGGLQLDTRDAGAARLLEGADLVLQALVLDPTTGELQRSERLQLTAVDAFVFELDQHQGGWRAALLGRQDAGPLESPSQLELPPNAEGVLWREWRGLPPGAEVELHVRTRVALTASAGGRLAGRLSSQRLQLVEQNGAWKLHAGGASLSDDWRALSADPAENGLWRVQLEGRTDDSGRVWIALRATADERPVNAGFERLTLLIRR